MLKFVVQGRRRRHIRSQSEDRLQVSLDEDSHRDDCNENVAFSKSATPNVPNGALCSILKKGAPTLNAEASCHDPERRSRSIPRRKRTVSFRFSDDQIQNDPLSGGNSEHPAPEQGNADAQSDDVVVSFTGHRENAIDVEGLLEDAGTSKPHTSIPTTHTPCAKPSYQTSTGDTYSLDRCNAHGVVSGAPESRQVGAHGDPDNVRQSRSPFRRQDVSRKCKRQCARRSSVPGDLDVLDGSDQRRLVSRSDSASTWDNDSGTVCILENNDTQMCESDIVLESIERTSVEFSSQRYATDSMDSNQSNRTQDDISETNTSNETSQFQDNHKGGVHSPNVPDTHCDVLHEKCPGNKYGTFPYTSKKRHRTNAYEKSSEDKACTLPRTNPRRLPKSCLIQDKEFSCDDNSSKRRTPTSSNGKYSFLRNLKGLARTHARLYKSDGDTDSSSSEEEEHARPGNPGLDRFLHSSNPGFVRCVPESRGLCSGFRSSRSSRTSDLSSMSPDSSSQRSDMAPRDTSYLVDSPSQDSSSGIASDDHHTASATSEYSPTYDVLEPRARVNLLKSRYPETKKHSRSGVSKHHSDQEYDSDYADLADIAKRTEYFISSKQGHQYSGLGSKDCGYHETNLDDPTSDCTFTFPESVKNSSTGHDRLPGQRPRSGRGCDSAPTLPQDRSSINKMGCSGYPGERDNGNFQHFRTTSDLVISDRLSPSSRSPDYVKYTTEYGLKGKHRVSYFEVMPDDLILRIFKHLSTDQVCRSARVCRRWYNLAWDPVLWTSIRITDSSVDVDKAMKVLTKRLSYETPTVCAILEKINLSGCEKLTDKGLYTIARRCSELRHLDLQGCCGISNIALFEVVSNCVNLEHLNVAGCSCVTCLCLTPEATIQAATYGKQIDLRYLDMTDCYNLDDAGLQIIASYCTKLTYIYLRRCPKITDIGVQYIANYCTNLKEFSISDCRNVTDFGLRELSKLGSNLRYLSVAKCDKISDVGIRYVARYCTRLRYLNVRGCEAVSDDSVEMLARCCTRLRSLDLGKCDVTDDGLESLAQYSKQLRKLSLKSCESISDRGLVILAQHCRGLQQLNIQDCHVTVEAYRTLKRYCKRCIIEHTNPSFY